MTARSAVHTRPRQPVVIHLVRHGESTWNAEGRLQGQVADVPLTHRGRGQARRAAAQLAGRGVDALVTSDLVRAAQTAHEVGVATGLVPVPEPALREQALGELQGRLTRDLQTQPPPPGCTSARFAGAAERASPTSTPGSSSSSPGCSLTRRGVGSPW